MIGMFNSDAVMASKEKEIKNWKVNNVYDEVADEGQSVLSTRWVMTMKQGKPKARLVVRGFEDEEVVQKSSLNI